MRRADIFEAPGSDAPPEMLTPPEVSHQSVGICEVSARRSRLQTERTSSRGSVGDVFPFPASLESSPVSEEHASASTSSQATQDVVSLDANEVIVLALSIEDCNFGPLPKAPIDITGRTICCFTDASSGPLPFQRVLCFENQVSPIVHRVRLVHRFTFCPTVFD